MADVIDLGSFKRKKETEKFDEAIKSIEEDEKELVLITMNAVFALLDNLQESDIDPADVPRSIADIYLIIEATASLVSRTKGWTHGMHKAADAFMGSEEEPPQNPFEATETHIKLMKQFLYGEQ